MTGEALKKVLYSETQGRVEGKSVISFPQRSCAELRPLTNRRRGVFHINIALIKTSVALRSAVRAADK